MIQEKHIIYVNGDKLTTHETYEQAMTHAELMIKELSYNVTISIEQVITNQYYLKSN